MVSSHKALTRSCCDWWSVAESINNQDGDNHTLQPVRCHKVYWGEKIISIYHLLDSFISSLCINFIIRNQWINGSCCYYSYQTTNIKSSLQIKQLNCDIWPFTFTLIITNNLIISTRNTCPIQEESIWNNISKKMKTISLFSFILFFAIYTSVSKSARKRRGLYVVEKIENGLKKYYLVQKKTLPYPRKKG